MKTKRELSIRDSLRKITSIQEDFISNKSFKLEERLNIVKYLEDVKTNICEVVSISNN